MIINLLVGHTGLGCQRSRQVPWTFKADSRKDGSSLKGTEFEKISHLGAGVASLLPAAHAQPVIDFRYQTVVV